MTPRRTSCSPAGCKLLNLRVLKLPREPMRVATQEKLARALPNATFDEPDPDRAAGRPAFYFRYVATME